MSNKKQSSIEQVFSHIKASRNDIQYWNDSMLVDWLLEQEYRLKAMHKEEVLEAVYDSMGTNFDPNMGRAELYYKEKYENGYK